MNKWVLRFSHIPLIHNLLLKYFICTIGFEFSFFLAASTLTFLMSSYHTILWSGWLWRYYCNLFPAHITSHHATSTHHIASHQITHHISSHHIFYRQPNSSKLPNNSYRCENYAPIPPWRLSKLAMTVMRKNYISKLNTLRTRQNDHHFPDGMSNCIFVNEDYEFWL